MKVLAIGGSGHVGALVTRALLKRGVEVRIFARKDGAPNLAGVEVAIGDLLDPASVESAMRGVDKLYLLNAVSPDELTQGLIAYDLAKRLRLRQVVYHSVYRADAFPDVPHFAAKAAIETALKAFDTPFTILRPSYFFQNDAGMEDAIVKGGVYPSPLGVLGVSAVDTRDIAEAAAIVLTTDGHAGKSYNINGPEALTGARVASIWSRLLDRPVRYGGHDLDAYQATMARHAPAWSAFDMRMMFQAYVEHGFSASAADLATLTALLGRPPRTYEAFARETLAAWSVPAPAS